MDMDRFQSDRRARFLLEGAAPITDTTHQIAEAQVHALIAIAEQLHEVADAIREVGSRSRESRR
jgi:hypothetical protein